MKKSHQEIFVFGSNTQGRHGKGVALEAKLHWGAKYGQPRGFQGRSYAIVTKELRKNRPAVTLDDIELEVEQFLDFAGRHRSEFVFRVSPIGCGLAGFTPEQIAPMFWGAPTNVRLPEEFAKVLRRNGARGADRAK